MCTPTSTDPQLEPLSIPTFSQIQSQPQTIESTSNETSLDNLYQDIDTVTRGFNPHAGPTTEVPSGAHTAPPEMWSQKSRNARKKWLKIINHHHSGPI